QQPKDVVLKSVFGDTADSPKESHVDHYMQPGFDQHRPDATVEPLDVASLGYFVIGDAHSAFALDRDRDAKTQEFKVGCLRASVLSEHSHVAAASDERGAHQQFVEYRCHPCVIG